MGESKRRAAAGYVPPPQLTERDRKELAIPAVLIGALAFANVFGPDPGSEDQEEALAQVEEKTKLIQKLIIDGITEPFTDCGVSQRSRLVKETTDLCSDCIRAMGFEDQASIKFAMTYYYWLSGFEC